MEGKEITQPAGAPKENKMGVMPVKRLIVSMSLPMMASMLVQALYNIVDSIFVAQIHPDALSALTLAFPMQNLMIAVGAGTGVGVNALLSRSLGEKNQERADKAANTGVLLALCSCIVFMIVGIFFAGAFIDTQIDPALANSERIVAYGTTYLSIVCTLSLGLFYQIVFERLLQSTGRTFYSMISQMTGAVINIIFDPIMIFGYFGFPALGVAGAAYATVLGQTVAAFIGLILNLKKNTDIHLQIALIIRPKAEIIRQVYFVGVPSILMMAIGSVMTYLLDQILLTFEALGTTAVAVFGVYFRLQSFFFMPVFGLNNGLIPVLAYNHGARKEDRIKEALKFSIVLALVIMLIGTVIFETVPGLLLTLFNADSDMMMIGVPALRIIALIFPVAALCIITGSIFQAFAKSYYSLIISVMRQLIVLIPAAWLLARTGVVQNVWWAFPIAETISMIASLVFFRMVYRDTVAQMKAQ